MERVRVGEGKEGEEEEGEGEEEGRRKKGRDVRRGERIFIRSLKELQIQTEMAGTCKIL